MTSRGIKLIISVLMLIGLTVVILAAAGQLDMGQTMPTESTIATGLTLAPTLEPTTASTTAESAAPTTAGGTTSATAAIIPLQPDLDEPPFEGTLRRWPAVSSLPDIRQTDLTVFRGRQKDARPLAGVTIILDPGHGGQDGGAVWPSLPARPEIIEKDIVLSVALKTRDRLLELGAEVVLTRDTDEWLSIYRRIGFAGQYAARRFYEELPEYGYEPDAVEILFPLLDEIITINSDLASSGGRGFLKGYGARPEARLLFDIQAQYPEVLFISLHCNAYADDSRVRGLQIFYQTNEGNFRAVTGAVADGKAKPAETPPLYSLFPDAGRLALATGIRNSILSRLPELKFSGYSDLLTADFAILRNINLVSVLVEMGYVTSPEDRKLLLSQEGQSKIAEAVAEAVFNYYCR